jgi:hypothetical protein
MDGRHEPTPEFERYLEWQVMTALRRQERFARPARTGYRQYLPTVAIVVASVLLGGAAVFASGRIQDNLQKQVLLEQQQGELRLAQMQLEIAQKTADEAKQRSARGLTGRAATEEADRDLQIAALRLQRIELNVDEVGRSGRPVQDDVTSPLVGGQDFVADRLNLDLRGAVITADAADRRRNEVRRRHEVGLATEVELLEAEADLARAASDVQSVQGRISLRQQFLGGLITVEEATRQRLLLAARSQLRLAQLALEVASKQYARLQAYAKVGTAAQVDVLKAELEMLVKRQDLTVLQSRIRMLEEGRIPADASGGSASGS